MKFQDDISNMNTHTHTHISTSRNQYVPHFLKVGGIKRRGIELCQARHHVVKSGAAEVKASAKGTIEGENTRGGMPPLLRGVRGISPEKIFDLWLPLCAFLMHFGSVFSCLGLIWNRWHCISIIEHWHRTIDTVSGRRIAMHANSKRKIHTLPSDMFFDLELLAKYIEGIKTFFCSAEKKHAAVVFSFIVGIQNEDILLYIHDL